MPPNLALLSTRSGSNYPCLELIFMVPKLFEPLKFDCSFSQDFHATTTKLLRMYLYKIWIFIGGGGGRLKSFVREENSADDNTVRIGLLEHSS